MLAAAALVGCRVRLEGQGQPLGAVCAADDRQAAAARILERLRGWGWGWQQAAVSEDALAVAGR